MFEDFRIALTEKYDAYLSDESKKRGHADSICFPKNKQELIEIQKFLERSKVKRTIQGGLTGIGGLAVPDGGCIINLSFFKENGKMIDLDEGKKLACVYSGVTLKELKEALFQKYIKAKTAYFWAMDPTEETATIGGIIATDAFGISSLHYGDVSQQVEKVEIVSVEGEIKVFTEYRQLQKQLYNGAVITRAWLNLAPVPEEVWNISFLFYDDQTAFTFLDTLKKRIPKNTEANIVAVEYMNDDALVNGNSMRGFSDKITIPEFEESIKALIFVEIHGNKKGIEDIAETLLVLSDECNIPEKNTWVFVGQTEAHRMRNFRHAVPEAINQKIGETHLACKKYLHIKRNLEKPSELLNSLKKILVREKIDGAVYGNGLIPYVYCDFLPGNQFLTEEKINKLKKELL